MEQVERGKRKLKTGVVVSNKMNKTVVVKVQRTFRHPKYEKVITRDKKYYAHCETPIEEGATVSIVETRPISKLKCWRVVEGGL